MREPDKNEIWASSHKTPLESLTDGLALSSVVYTVHYGEPTTMFGVAPQSILSGNGVVWALGTENVRSNWMHFLRQSRYFIDLIWEGYDRLVNYVDARHKESILWLRWLGAKIYPAQPFGLEGLPFHYFELR